MKEATWLPWIGLPQIDGADPRAGVGGCCFRLAQTVREELGLPWPAERMASWYDRAEQGDWAGLREDWFCSTVICSPLPGTITMLDREPPPGAFGLAVLVDGRTALTALHGRGVVAIPQALWAAWEWREPLL